MKTANVYIDGFNLYYGCFDDKRKRADWRQYRWLDLGAFCANALPNYQINRIRYFTALVNPRPHNPDCQLRQLIYLRALATIPHLTIHHGRFAINAKERACAVRGAKRPTPEVPLRLEYVIQDEEKGSDVNLATYLLFDAFKPESDIVVVVSNDSDLVEPIRLVRSELGREVHILNPRNWPTAHLANVADYLDPIRRWMVKNSQFPTSFSDAQGTITKPARWV